MPKLIAPLSQAKVNNAQASDKPYKLYDGGGLFLEVMPSGARIWRLKFQQKNGKENRLTFGPYPDVSLEDARAKRAEARRLIQQGIDPAMHRDATRELVAERAANTFEKVAREWYAHKVPTWSERTATNMILRLEAVSSGCKLIQAAIEN